MKYKKFLVIGLLFLFFLNLYSEVVVAQNFLTEGAENLVEIFKDPKNVSANSELIKLILMIMVLVLVYSAMSTVSFPPNVGLRLILSIAISFLGVVLISQDEILQSIYAYKALGITIILFIPLVALALLTYSMAVELNVFGLMIQKFLWWGYSLFLLFYAGSGLLFRYWNFSINEDPDLLKAMRVFFGDNMGVATLASSGTLVMLVILSLLIMYFFAIRNQSWVNRFHKAVEDGKIEKYFDLRKKARISNREAARDIDETSA
jgi:hypothetical protein